MIKVLSVYDYTKCELPKALFEIKVSQKDIDAMIKKAAEHFLTIEDQDGQIIKGDIVAVKIDSSDVLLNSEIERFVVGKGFFSKEIEQALIGKKKGDKFSLMVDGSSADITVLWVRRRIVPELNDEMAASLGIEEVTNREEYEQYATSELENEDKEKKQNAIWLIISKKLASESKFEIDEKEIDARYKKDLAYLTKELGDDFEEFMEVKYHGKTLEESKKKFKEQIINDEKLVAIATPLAEEDGVEFTEEEYNEMIDEMVNGEYTKEELQESMSYEDYVSQQLQGYLQAKVLEYFDDRFVTTIVE